MKKSPGSPEQPAGRGVPSGRKGIWGAAAPPPGGVPDTPPPPPASLPGCPVPPSRGSAGRPQPRCPSARRGIVPSPGETLVERHRPRLLPGGLNADLTVPKGFWKPQSAPRGIRNAEASVAGKCVKRTETNYRHRKSLRPGRGSPGAVGFGPDLHPHPPPHPRGSVSCREAVFGFDGLLVLNLKPRIFPPKSGVRGRSSSPPRGLTKHQSSPLGLSPSHQDEGILLAPGGRGITGRK